MSILSLVAVCIWQALGELSLLLLLFYLFYKQETNDPRRLKSWSYVLYLDRSI